ncbi:MAG TPA: 6-carboxytetrahydropterin synthase [Candidatus Acidoferrales bacterium]|nr:6-carboxytetrahydropterin synthase [Candidatus Acidoferrales bacterium]
MSDKHPTPSTPDRQPALRVVLHRRYHFSASHRLHQRHWTGEQNLRVYGKCANPHGHGHNYVLDVGVTGPVDLATGMITNLADLDAFVEREILAEFDHVYLNEQVPAFRDNVPTTENICREVFRRMRPYPHARLETIGIEETGNNSFEYSGD